MVELESDRTGKIACAEYRVVLDENSVLRHSDYRITKVMDAFIKDDPEKMLLAAKAHTLARRIPDLRIDAAGAVSGPTDAEWAERAFASFGIPTDPELAVGELMESTELLVYLSGVVDPNTFRPLVMSRLVGAVVGDPDHPQGQEYESQVWTFDWAPSEAR